MSILKTPFYIKLRFTLNYIYVCVFGVCVGGGWVCVGGGWWVCVCVWRGCGGVYVEGCFCKVNEFGILS